MPQAPVLMLGVAGRGEEGTLLLLPLLARNDASFLLQWPGLPLPFPVSRVKSRCRSRSTCCASIGTQVQIPSTQVKKLGMTVNAYNTSTGRQRKSESRESLASQPSQYDQLLIHWETLSGDHKTENE